MDASAFEAELPELRRKLLHFARFHCRTHEDAEDVVQVALLKGWLAIGEFREESNLLTWLHRIAINEIFDGKRKGQAKGRSLVFPLDEVAYDLVEPSQSPEQLLLTREREQLVHDAVEKLPRGIRTGLRCRLAGTAVKGNLNTQKVRVFRGIIMLRERNTLRSVA